MRSSALLATCVALVAMSSVARADLILVGTTPATSVTDITGLGSVPQLMSLSNNGSQSATTTPPNMCAGNCDRGSGAFSTPTLAALGWTGGGPDVGLGLNINQNGNTVLTLTSLTLTIFNGTTPLSTTFSLASPIAFSPMDQALGPGSGSHVFNFVLTGVEQAAFNTILAMPGSAGFTAGLSASFTGSNAGSEIFHGFDQALTGVAPPPISEIPLPAALPLFATGLAALGLLGRRRKRRAQAVARANNSIAA